MTETHTLHRHVTQHDTRRRSLILQLPPRSNPSPLTRNVGGVELPAPGLWNIPKGWVSIELCVPRIFRPALRAHIRLKHGMIAIADDPTHSTAHLSLDAATLRTGDAARDLYLHNKVLDIGRDSAIPVQIAAVEHRGGPVWNAFGSISVRGVATPVELEVTCEGVSRGGSIARFRASATIPLHNFLPVNNGLRGRFLAGRNVRIVVDLQAEPVRASTNHPSWTPSSREPKPSATRTDA